MWGGGGASWDGPVVGEGRQLEWAVAGRGGSWVGEVREGRQLGAEVEVEWGKWKVEADEQLCLF